MITSPKRPPSALKTCTPNKYARPVGPGTSLRPRQPLGPAPAPTSLASREPHPQPLLCLDVPPISPIPSSTSLPVIPITVRDPRKFSKRDPKRILSDIKSLIDAEECGKNQQVGSFVSNTLYPSTKAVLGVFEHNLPIVVFPCIEELYRSGISTLSNPTPTSPSTNKFVRRTLSSFPPDAAEYIQPHKFGLNASLKDKGSDDIYALLTLFLSRLPEPVLAPTDVLPGLRNAFWVWCVKLQSVVGGLAAKTTTWIRIAQMLLGLLPTANLSLFVYLMAFSCQVLEVRIKKRRRASAARDSLVCAAEGGVSVLEAQLLALESELEGKNERENEKRRLGMAWGVWLFGKDDQEDDGRLTLMMVWFVTHWNVESQLIVTWPSTTYFYLTEPRTLSAYRLLVLKRIPKYLRRAEWELANAPLAIPKPPQNCFARILQSAPPIHSIGADNIFHTFSSAGFYPNMHH
ncbi:hypothetical protein EV368DRAFT_89067 [Lentinula lateritia]|nr:hypothetical protein EV368DRAFT_89067 [Lentinula lateritia]